MSVTRLGPKKKRPHGSERGDPIVRLREERAASSIEYHHPTHARVRAAPSYIAVRKHSLSPTLAVLESSN